MVFTTQIFLFIFFPLSTLAFLIADRLERLGAVGRFLRRARVKDVLVIAISLAFYAWACFDDVFKLIIYVLVVYAAARLIERSRRRGYYLELHRESRGETVHKKVYMAVVPFVFAVGAVVLCLVLYKYTNFFIGIWNVIFSGGASPKSVLAPLGLSFITFSAVSYLADVYRGKAASGSLVDCAFYLTFFPKVVSGPIVLWHKFQPQIGSDRKLTLEAATDGLDRIMIGFAKKVILADTFGACLSGIGLWGIDKITAAGTLVLYMLQIYYDFSGYSDIAIGLSRLFGFGFEENFNFPYRSKSISEFWRRWHISLGAWFREYVYFPLGGSRAGMRRTLRNLAVVFVLTGIWHGAGWNYIVWGAINGAFVIAERLIGERAFYKKIPDAVKWLSTMMIVMCFWQLFRYEDIANTAKLFAIIAGARRFDTIFYTWQHYFDARIICFAVIGIMGSTLAGSPKVKSAVSRISATKGGYLLREVAILAVFALAVMFMVNSTYSPFLYFQY